MKMSWSPYAKAYDPLAAGSIDGTDTIPHDQAIVRASEANYSTPKVPSDPECTIFVGRLSFKVTEDLLWKKFSNFGEVQSVKLIKDIITGVSKGYAFVEYKTRRHAKRAYQEGHNMILEGRPVLVDFEVGRTLCGWVPRRLGGGWGGRKEAGQLRFGCRDRPWKKPIILPISKDGIRENDSRLPLDLKKDKNLYNKHSEKIEGANEDNERQYWRDQSYRQDRSSHKDREYLQSKRDREEKGMQTKKNREEREYLNGKRYKEEREYLHSKREREEREHLQNRKERHY